MRCVLPIECKTYLEHKRRMRLFQFMYICNNFIETTTQLQVKRVKKKFHVELIE